MERTINRFHNVMLSAASRYAIPGKLDVEDLYQEVTLGLMDAWSRYKTLPTKEFDKLAKTAIWHTAQSAVQAYLTVGRNYHKEVSGSQEVNSEDGGGDFFAFIIHNKRTPLDEAIHNEFIKQVRAELGEGTLACRVFDEVLNPSEQLRAEYIKMRDERKWGEFSTKEPENIPRECYAKALKVPHSKIRYAWEQIMYVCDKIFQPNKKVVEALTR